MKMLKLFVVIILLVSIHTTVIAATTGIVNVDTVRVRKEATTDSEIVELVSIGDKIKILGKEGNWYKVKVNSVTGYIREDLLTVEGEQAGTDIPVSNNEPTPEKPPVSEEPGNGGETNIPAENSGSTASSNSTNISVLKTTGHISVGQRVKLSAETKVKILPSANSTNIADLSADTEVEITEIINKWCRIETEGAYGWVRIDQ